MRMDVLIVKIWGGLDYNIKYSNVNGGKSKILTTQQSHHFQHILQLTVQHISS